MSSKEKPSLGGARIKTRKRNIAVPHDPNSFADAVIQIYKEHQGDLELVYKELDGSELDFSRYGETFFEVVFSGGRLMPGSSSGKTDESAHMQWNVFDSPTNKENVMPYVFFVQKMLRRRPFMIKTLENVFKRALQSLELFPEDKRQKLALLLALCFSQRFTGLSPEFVCVTLLNENLVAKGSSLSLVTDFFRFYLAETSMDELIALLKKGKVEERLLDFMPLQKRTPQHFSDHFNAAGLSVLVDYNKKIMFETKLKELEKEVSEMILENDGDEPKASAKAEVNEVIQIVELRRKEGILSESDVVKSLWDTVIGAIDLSGKNQQQNANTAIRQVKQWSKLFSTYCTTAKIELELLYKIQTYCYDDAKLQKIFPDFIKTLYDTDVIAEDTVMLWYKKGTNPKGRNLFVKSLEPFIEWLEEAEEEED